MCGFGMDTIFRVAIFIVIFLGLLALIQYALGGWLSRVGATTYWPVIQIVIGVIVAILILLFLWRLAECARLVQTEFPYLVLTSEGMD